MISEGRNDDIVTHKIVHVHKYNSMHDCISSFSAGNYFLCIKFPFVHALVIGVVKIQCLSSFKYMFYILK